MASPLSHYERHRDTYNQISDELSRVNTAFMSADRFTQKVMLFDSTVFAVLSVQNDISILRKAFRGYMEADSWDDVREVCKHVNYGNNKFDYIRANFDRVFGQAGDDIIHDLTRGNTWDAVAQIVETMSGLSWVKAPFVGAMLGFESLICIDTNVAQMVPGAKAKGYSGVDEYRETVQDVKDEYPELAEQVSTFMLQWIVFDANRETGVARHEEWFEAMLPGSVFGRQTGLDAY